MPTAWAEGPSNTRRHPDPIRFKAGQGLYSRSLCLPFCVSSSLACPHLSSASGESQDFGLFAQRKEAGGFDCLSQFPDFRLLARKVARAPYLRNGFELVHVDGRVERFAPTTPATQFGFQMP